MNLQIHAYQNDVSKSHHPQSQYEWEHKSDRIKNQVKILDGGEKNDRYANQKQASYGEWGFGLV